MDLSIVIVNWNSKEYLRKCLGSIVAETHGLEYEIIVIDSASFDGCGEMLRAHFPEVRFVQSEVNLGFAKANNMAAENATGDVLLFLNPDTELCGPAIAAMHRALSSLPDAGAVGAKLLNTDGTIQNSCVRAFPTIWNQVLDMETLRNRFPRWPIWGADPLYGESQEPQAVEAVSGACLMVERQVFEDAGRFSEEYFMYSEDVDLCFKLRQLNRRNYYVASAVVVHHGGGSSQRCEVSAFSSVMMVESRWRFFIKTRSRVYCWLYRAAIFLLSVLRILAAAIAAMTGHLSEKRTRWDGVIQKWGARLRWSIGLENWAHDYPGSPKDHGDKFKEGRPVTLAR